LIIPITIIEFKLYSRANLFLKASWKSVLESILPESKISKGSAGSQFPRSELRRITKPNTDPSGGVTTTAGRASQDTQSATSDSLNINSTSKNIITGGTLEPINTNFQKAIINS
jgi:hypothetical protein